MANNPFLDNKAFQPQITTEVKKAYDDNLKKEPAPGTQYAADVSVRGLGELVKSATQKAKAEGNEGLQILDALLNPNTRQAFETYLAESRELFGYIGLTIPTLKDCMDCGIDIPSLGTIYERMVHDGLEPELALSPVLPLPIWRELYQYLAYDPVINHDKRMKGPGLNSLLIGYNSWETLAAIPDDAPVILSRENMLMWSLRIIPGTASPNELTDNHDHNGGVHPTVSEYLTVQAIRLKSNREPIDSTSLTQTWLYDTSPIDLQSHHGRPVGTWNQKRGWVTLIWSDGYGTVSKRGTRLPEWK